MQGIRGATTVEKNDKETIMEAVQELLTILTNDNDLKLEYTIVISSSLMVFLSTIFDKLNVSGRKEYCKNNELRLSFFFPNLLIL